MTYIFAPTLQPPSASDCWATAPLCLLLTLPLLSLLLICCGFESPRNKVTHFKFLDNIPALLDRGLSREALSGVAIRRDTCRRKARLTGGRSRVINIYGVKRLAGMT